MGFSDSVKKIHWIGCDKVIKSKEEGVLGLQSAEGRNIALLSKLNWRFHTEREALWAVMKKGMDTFRKSSRWMVGRDSNLNLWVSNWTNGGPL